MFAQATALVASYDALTMVAIALFGIVTVTVWTLTARTHPAAQAARRDRSEP